MDEDPSNEAYVLSLLKGSLWAFGLPDPIGSGSSGNEKFG
jgi:hypothetical protein